MEQSILVIGGTGKTGRKVVQRLQEQGHNPRIGSRNAAIPFDWQDATTWQTAMEGIEKMYVTFQPDLAVPGAVEIITALTEQAKQSGVKKIVLLSGKGEIEAERCEQIVINSGIAYTITRASWFSQNFSESFFIDPILAGHVALPKPEAKVPYVDTGDIADVVVEALLNEKHNGKLYELTGPRLLTFPEVVNEIATASGREIPFTPISLEAFIDALKKAGVPSDYTWLINYLFAEVLDAKGNDIVSNDIEKVLGRKAKDFSEYARETAKTGVWNTVLEHN
ncbi:NAD(P)H-binding protein [Flammeovirgaceae bacterium SG7u.111]|nr:NAD(P)H-binding protein [Flammeovirgaceae bacterium SG7u.132]WPO33127.1 NAD(P)H-binding protein [Flammeovirgaceae bacterium SG7u.111]